MKKIILFLLVLTSTLALAQQPYYDDVDVTLTGQALYIELQNKISNANPSFNYGDIRDVVKITDEDPDNSANVLLVYGSNDNDGNCTTDRSRDKDDFGGTGCDYNREHVFATSNANPEMGSPSNSTTGIAADPHNIRPSDQQMNNNKGTKRFATGSGPAGDVGSGDWYPGNEWKGDVARMMMYMYTRYGDRCLPSLNGNSPLQGSTQMLQIYLQWNVDDPVSEMEDQRNPYLQNVYGNRNPFIDQPALATAIWGGPQAEDRWSNLSVTENNIIDVSVYPNPVLDNVFVSTSTSVPLEEISVYDVNGRLLQTLQSNDDIAKINTQGMQSGIYFLKIVSANGTVTKRISKQ